MSKIINKLFKSHLFHNWTYSKRSENSFQTMERNCNCGCSEVYDRFFGGTWFSINTKE
jgi:hypothetical protein